MTDCRECKAPASVTGYPCGITARGERIIRWHCAACGATELRPPIARWQRPDA